MLNLNIILKVESFFLSFLNKGVSTYKLFCAMERLAPAHIEKSKIYLGLVFFLNLNIHLNSEYEVNSFKSKVVYAK